MTSFDNAVAPRFNWRAIAAIYRFEMARTLRTPLQSVVSPVLSTSLYFVVFGAAIGSRMQAIDGVAYGAFIVPGLIMLTLLTQSIANASFAIYFPKFTGTIYELLSAPVVGSSRKRMRGSWASALAIMTRRFMPPERRRIWVSRLSQSERSRRICSIRAGSLGLPKRPRLKETVARTVSKASVVSSCGTRPILARAAR